MTIQESIDDILARLKHALLQRERAAREWERQSNQWEQRWRDVTTERDALSRQLADLLAIIGTETPIAAFDLVTTWRTEKQAYMDRIVELESKIDHYLAERDISDLMHDVQIQERDEARRELATLRAAHTAQLAKDGHA